MPESSKSWAQDLISGFVVSLIALPLGLGLAIASGVPPMAGIVASVIGGVIVAIIGGSHVTISGPGNGLVVVILSAVLSLGEGDLLQGYYFTLGAIVVSGGLMILLGFLRLGNLADFFPSSSIQGMLSAIGLIIIAKQIHVMLGNPGLQEANSLMSLIRTPESILALFQGNFIPWVGIIGVLSLALMVLYPKIPFRSFHAIPAPMWIVVGSIAFYYYFQFFTSASFPIEAKDLIQVPENLLDGIAFPNFSKWNTGNFVIAVIGITLIASIESLLSIKAVDRLDPQKRRSNANKDLKAIGLASILSGFLGGLPVVIVIARSSVNVNNGAVSRKSNFFHALLVFLMLALFGTYLNQIPLSALAAILVFTGYKLAAPSHFKRMFLAGKDQFIIFLVTLFSTLIFGLVIGIGIGILATYLIQLYLTEDRWEFFKQPFRPNTLMFEEADGSMVLSVRGHSSFINFLSLKSQLDTVPAGTDLILDYSLANFIDSSVMEHVHHFNEDFKKKGGTLEVVGLDIHDTHSNHPFAARRLIRLTSFIKKGGILTNRQLLLKEFSKEIDWSFKTNSVFEVPSLKDFPFFRTKSIDHAYNVFKGKYNDIPLRLMDLEFFEGEFIARENHKHTIMLIETPWEMPKFRLDKEGVMDRIAGMAGFQDINIDGHEDFSHRFLLRGEDEKAIIKFFSDDLILFFESHPYYHIESNGKSLIIFKGQRVSTIREVKALASFGKSLTDELLKLVDQPSVK